MLVLGIDIIHAWLINTYQRVGRAEFALSWLCFSCTLVLTSLMPISVRTVGRLDPAVYLYAVECAVCNSAMCCCCIRQRCWLCNAHCGKLLASQLCYPEPCKFC